MNLKDRLKMYKFDNELKRLNKEITKTEIELMVMKLDQNSRPGDNEKLLLCSYYLHEIEEERERIIRDMWALENKNE